MHIENIITPTANNANNLQSSKNFWKFIKHQKKDFSGIPSLKVNGKFISDPKEKANALNLQFKSVFTQETDYQEPQKILSPEIPDITITTQGVLNLLR